jgi:spore germination protein PC
MNDLQYQIQVLHEQVKHQNYHIHKLQQTIKLLEDDIKQLKEKPQTNIEKIEYKFDQLKVETLDGTLNIGFTPNGSGSDPIEEFAVNQSTDVPHILHTHPELYPTLQERVNHFIEHESMPLFQSLEKKHNITLDSSQRQFIIDDIKKQISERVYFYLNKLDRNKEDFADRVQIEEKTFERVRNDVERAISSFIEKIPKGGQS